MKAFLNGENGMDRIAVVTGGDRGIGAAVSAKLADDGYRVLICYNTARQKAEELKEKIMNNGGAAEIIKCDLRNEEDIRKTAEYAEKLGETEILVNNAGVSVIGQIQDMTAEQIDWILDVNVRGMILMSREMSRPMISRKRGCMINISSMWGVTGASCETVYSASKAAVIGFTKALAKEIGPSGIRVNCIAPGVINTEMNSHLSEDDLRVLSDETPLGFIGEPDDVADAVSDLVRSRFITGQVLGVDGGFAV